MQLEKGSVGRLTLCTGNRLLPGIAMEVNSPRTIVHSIAKSYWQETSNFLQKSSLRLQYQFVRETHTNTYAVEDGATRSTEQEPLEEGEEEAEDPDKDDQVTKMMTTIRKAHNTFCAGFIDTKIKLGKYQDNKYSGNLF